jgi:hypothetical protein
MCHALTSRIFAGDAMTTSPVSVVTNALPFIRVRFAIRRDNWAQRRVVRQRTDGQKTYGYTEIFSQIVRHKAPVRITARRLTIASQEN